MNSLAPTAIRISCFNTRTIFRQCPKVDSLAARVARGIRPYSFSPSRQIRPRAVDRKPLSQSWQGLNLWNLPAGVRTFASQRIITRFEDLPADYRIEDGLPFREKPLTQPEAVAIFGKLLDANTANRLLRFIHGRRIAGTLEDPTLSNPYQQQTFEVGLKWLREHVPVDEIECAGLRAEQELAELEGNVQQDNLARGERMGLYKRSPKNITKEKKEVYRPNSKQRNDVYGKSGLDAIREANEKAFDKKEAEEQARLAKEQGIPQKTGTLEKLSARSQVELRRPGQNPRLKYYLERAKILPDKPPEMSKFQRLWPSALVVLAFVTGCIIFAQVYTPPKKDWRMWPDVPQSAATVIGIILANTIILGAWRVPMLFRVLNKYFITVPGYPFPLSLIGNVFSHQTLSHFAINMAVLWFVGTRLHEEVGRGNFLAIYLGCGALGSFASLTSWVLKNNFASSSLGASGALCGILAAYLLLNSSERVTFFGFPPDDWPSISAMTLLIFMIGLDIVSMRKAKQIVTVDHWAHLGGYFSGMGAAAALKMRASQREKVEMERRKNLGIIDRIREGRT
ncbi:related to mitochondrial rhomboid protease [Phialocephala subalpina]|uniref:Related to mitochondrial rhomboid protease n=1 Tax=Phialocephala subalpina TaxID=576137 RepID=A0A1L7X730_9HELO|nr:related to mitochondrial rhomboid protease [Phialocephala subalpina]